MSAITCWWMLIACAGWATAIQCFGMYRIEKWRADEFKRLHDSALKHWDEARAIAVEMLGAPPSLLNPRRDKEFKS